MELEKNDTLFYDLCRLCLEEPGINSIHDNTHLPEDIYLCTGIKVLVSDNLPGKICKKCSNTIKISIEFRELVAKNDTHLKALFGEIKDENTNENLLNISNNGVKCTSCSKEKEGATSTVPIELNKDDKEKSCTKKQTCLVQPLKMITVRKDLFPDSARELPTKENIRQEIVKAKKIKKQEVEITRYRCEDCCKNFGTWKKLYLHARLHKKNIACPTEACGKKFATKGDLEKHVRTHTGEKPYRCDHCNRSFAQKGSLKSHIETVHGSKSSKER